MRATFLALGTKAHIVTLSLKWDFAYIVCLPTSLNGDQKRIGFSSYIKITNTTPRYCQGISHCHLRIYRKIVSGRMVLGLCLCSNSKRRSNCLCRPLSGGWKRCLAREVLRPHLSITKYSIIPPRISVMFLYQVFLKIRIVLLGIDLHKVIKTFLSCFRHNKIRFC